MGPFPQPSCPRRRASMFYGRRNADSRLRGNDDTYLIGLTKYQAVATINFSNPWK